MKDSYEFKIRRVGDITPWKDLKVIPANGELSEDEAQEVAFTMAITNDVFEVRHNKVGSLQGHYTPGLTPRREAHHAAIDNNRHMITITRNGQAVDCYGKWEEDSNADCVFEDEAFDGTWSDGADNWTEVVEELTKYAAKNGTVLIQMEAC
jgi:sugar phosphate isomerase/epimerase